MEKKKFNTKALVGLSLMTALVIVLQVLTLGLRSSFFNITLCLVPIVVGAALYGWKAGAWLGFVFGVVVLLTDAQAFLAINVPGTIITCILKGTLAGLCAGVVYRLIRKKSKLAAVIAAGIVSPVVNTGVFLLGCVLFFMDTIKEWAAGMGFENVGVYMVTSFVGLNFVIELAVNLVLSSAIVAIIEYGVKSAKE